jgi:diguanylate cyclase (GGDEF)-like protein
MVKPVDTRELIAKIRSSVHIKGCVERAARAAGARPIRMICDELAGSCSRGFLEAMIAQEARRAERHGGTFSLLVSALEGFEQFKKAFGHEWVRAAVRHAARILRRSTRECDVLARLDESRLALLLPGTGSEGLPALRSRLKVNFQRLPVEFHSRWMKAPVLLGAASFPEFVGTAKSMIAAAGEDLRRSRETRGRSRSSLIA